MGKFSYLLMTAAGVMAVSAGLPPTTKLARTLLATSSASVPSTVAAAADGRWVTLTDAKLRCETRAVHKEAMTFFLATDTALANPFVAQYVGVVGCEAAQQKVEGVFVPGTLTLADLGQWGIDAKGATGLRLITPVATPRYLRAAIVPFALILLVGALVAGYGLRGLLRRSGDARR
jgi:hypothetical protein